MQATGFSLSPFFASWTDCGFGRIPLGFWLSREEIFGLSFFAGPAKDRRIVRAVQRLVRLVEMDD